MSVDPILSAAKALITSEVLFLDGDNGNLLENNYSHYKQPLPDSPYSPAQLQRRSCSGYLPEHFAYCSPDGTIMHDIMHRLHARASPNPPADHTARLPEIAGIQSITTRTCTYKVI